MPSVKQGGGYTLTFSRKNQDVRELLEQEKKNGAIISDFICEAIRFYVENRNKLNKLPETNNNIDMKHIENLIEQKIKESLATVTIEKKEPSKTERLEDISSVDNSDIQED